MSIMSVMQRTAPLVLALAFVGAGEAHAISLMDISTLAKPWLLIGTGSPNDSTTPEGKFNKGVGNAVDVSNYELGANKAPVPANQDPPLGTGQDWNPDLKFDSSVPRVPGVANPFLDAGPMGITGKLPTPHIITFDGNVAVTHLAAPPHPLAGNNGRFHLSNVGVFAQNPQAGLPILGIPGSMPGVNCAGAANTNVSANGCIQQTSLDSFFNDVNYPNSLGNPTPNTGDPAKTLLPGNGITGGVNFSALRTALDEALTLIPGLPPLVAPSFCQLELNNSGMFNDVCMGSMLDLTTIAAGEPNMGLNLAGEIKGDNLNAPTTLYVKLNDGLNIIDIKTGGNDFKLTNANIIIDGSAAAHAIFRVPTGENWIINQGNVLVGNMGIGLQNVLFFSDTTQQSATYKFNDTLFNGIAFWTLGDGSGIHVNNSQGCVQMVGDKINLQNVRYMRCSFMEMHTGEPIPEPATLSLFGLGAGLLGLRLLARRRGAGG